MLNVSRDQEKIQHISADILAAFNPRLVKIPAFDYCYQIFNLLKIVTAPCNIRICSKMAISDLNPVVILLLLLL